MKCDYYCEGKNKGAIPVRFAEGLSGKSNAIGKNICAECHALYLRLQSFPCLRCAFRFVCVIFNSTGERTFKKKVDKFGVKIFDPTDCPAVAAKLKYNVKDDDGAETGEVVDVHYKYHAWNDSWEWQSKERIKELDTKRKYRVQQLQV